MDQTMAHGGIVNQYQPHHSFPAYQSHPQQQIPVSHSADVFFNPEPTAYTPGWILPPATSTHSLNPHSYTTPTRQDAPPHFDHSQTMNFSNQHAPGRFVPISPFQQPRRQLANMGVAAVNNTAAPNPNHQRNPAVPPNLNRRQNPAAPPGNAANPIRGRNRANLAPDAVPRFIPGPIQPIPPFNPQNQAAIAAAANNMRPLPPVPPQQQQHFVVPTPNTKEIPILSLSMTTSWASWDMAVKTVLSPWGLLGHILDPQNGYSFITASYPPPPGHAYGTPEHQAWDEWWCRDGAVLAALVTKLAPESAAVLPQIDDIFQQSIPSHQIYSMLKSAHFSSTWADVIRIRDQLYNTISGSSPEAILSFVRKWRSDVAAI
ncbi:hypothetical protein C8J56DRAFT_901268 [Mycena floridula]|nr:hypothetical protein C8J56DRAFT_901268 [Mycena floridula]